LNDSGTASRNNATANILSGKTVGYDGDEPVSGCIGKGDSIDVKDDAINAGEISVSTSLTLSAWTNTASYVPWAHLIAKSSAPGSKTPWLAWGMQMDSCDTPHLSITITTDNGDSSVETSSTVPLHSWVFVTGTYDGDRLRIFYNGSLETDVPFSGTIVQNSNSVFFGKLQDSPELRFNGIIDEIRICSVAQSSNWIKLCYENQKQNSTFVVFLNKQM
jgi:hypothetical protein